VKFSLDCLGGLEGLVGLVGLAGIAGLGSSTFFNYWMFF
jgi:hypothetical protein